MIHDNFIRQARATRVINGDTFEADIDLGFGTRFSATIQLAGANTPERGEQGYQEAKDYLTERFEGRDLSILFPGFKKDGFGRLIGEVYLDEENIGLELIQLGLAIPYMK